MLMHVTRRREIAAGDALAAPAPARLTERLCAEPGQHNVANGSLPGHIAVALYQQSAGMERQQVGYRANQAAFPDRLSGEVSLMAADAFQAFTVAEHANWGRIPQAGLRIE